MGEAKNLLFAKLKNNARKMSHFRAITMTTRTLTRCCRRWNADFLTRHSTFVNGNSHGLISSNSVINNNRSLNSLANRGVDSLTDGNSLPSLPFTRRFSLTSNSRLSLSPSAFSSSSSASVGDKKKGKSTLKKPFTPKGKFDLEDDAKKKELDRIREELKMKEAAERMEEEEAEAKKKQAEENELTYGERINEMTGERDGPKGQEPTEYGDWQRKGRVSDF